MSALTFGSTTLPSLGSYHQHIQQHQKFTHFVVVLLSASYSCILPITTNNKSVSLQYSKKWNGHHWNTIAKIQHFVLMYKIVHNLVAVPSSSLVPADSRTRAHHSYKFRTISTNTSQRKNSFFPLTIPQRNALNRTTVESDSLDILKNRLP